jgi:hypothetical protein
MTYRLIAPCLVAAAVFAAFLGPLTSRAEAPASRPALAPAGAAETRPDNAASRNPPFIRFSDDGRGGGTLETAITSYRNAEGVVVHLVAAVHVGEADYYRGLSDTFETYDALLFELVMPKDGAVPGSERAAGAAAAGTKQAGERKGERAGARPPPTRVRGAGAIGGLQGLLRDVLALEFQLDAINYDRPNFVHADLDAETFNAMQAERKESIFGLMLRALLNDMKRQQSGTAAPPITAFDLLAAMASPDSARQYKLLLARQFGDIEAQIAAWRARRGRC